MTKADLVAQVADAIGPGITKKDCALVVDGFLNAMKQALAQGNGIEIRGFGSFKLRHRKGRMARNPRTGEAVGVPARTYPVFKPSKYLRAQVALLDLVEEPPAPSSPRESGYGYFPPPDPPGRGQSR